MDIYPHVIDSICRFPKHSSPKDSTANLRFCDIREDRVSSVAIGLKQDGHLLFDFALSLTIAMWIKCNQRGNVWFVGTKPAEAPRFLAYPSLNADQLAYAFGNVAIDNSIAQSTIDNTDVNTWRHIAVVYRRPIHVSFYRNGIKWSLKQKMADAQRTIFAEEMYMFESSNRYTRFIGQMACVMIFQTPVAGYDIRKIKNTCP